MGGDGDTWGDDEETSALERPVFAERYEDRGRIARGASGEIRRVHDTRLDTSVVMKILWWDHLDNPRVRARFWAEANVTASLQHPGIVPVHDRGELVDGRLFFTMPEVRGQTLSQVLTDQPPTPDARRRTLRLVQRVCDAVAYAHSLGVVHRDLKPDNIMIGAHGEVLVMDWGLARVVDASEDVHLPVDPTRTGMGAVLGTPAYMSPEQARGDNDQVDARSDVYALGQILHHVLRGTPPLLGSSEEMWRRLLRGPVPIFEDGAADVHVELQDICRTAMAWQPGQRYRHAGELAEVLATWLDGAMRRARALEMVARADELLPDIEQLRQQAESLYGQAVEALSGIARHAPVADKRRGWALEDQAKTATRMARRLEIERVQRLRSALNEVSDLRQAHIRLAEHYERELLAAESRADHDRVQDLEALVRAHDTGTHTRWLRGDGALTLLTDPPGAEVRLHRVELQGRRLEPVFERVLGTTPLHAVPLARGSYLLVLRRPGHPDVRYPVLIERAQHWDGGPPVRLPTAVDGCYIPGGWFWSGGDPEVADGLPARRLWLDGFVMQRHPVTVASYQAFVDTLPDPQQFRPGRDVDHPHIGAPDEPVRFVSLRMARAYARYLTSRDGLPWRLPFDQEWEKAARGVDRRPFPWGSMPEPTWTLSANSTGDKPRVRPVGSCPADVSIYGVEGLAGNVRDWTETPYARRWTDPGRVVGDEELAVIRGGNVGSGMNHCRAALRLASPVHARLAGVGFRLVHTTARQDPQR